MNVLDYIIIAITLVFIIISVYKGLMFSLLSLFGGAVNIYLSTLLTKPISLLVSKIGITGAINASYVSKFAGLANFNTAFSSIEASNLKTFIDNAINTSNLSGLTKTLTKWFLNIPPETVQNNPDLNLSQVLSNAYSNFWSTLIAFAASFILITLTLFIVSKICKKAKENKTVNTVDRILGFFFGIIRSALIICIIFGVISLFNPNGALGNVISYINSSKIGGFIFKHVNSFVETFITTTKIL